MGESRFEYAFEFAEKIESEIVQIGSMRPRKSTFLLEFPFNIYVFL
jgi:hypothetical protein